MLFEGRKLSQVSDLRFQQRHPVQACVRPNKERLLVRDWSWLAGTVHHVIMLLTRSRVCESLCLLRSKSAFPFLPTCLLRAY